MAQVNTLIHKFSAGEASVAALARVDQERLRLMAEVQENIMPHAIGKGQVRPGTKYIGATKSNAAARMIPFVKAVDDTAILELTDGHLRVWVDDALVTRESVSTAVLDGTFATASTNLLSSATLSTSTLLSGTTANLVDADETTTVVWNASATGTLTADMGSAKTVYWIALTSTTTPNRAPNAFTVKGSATGAWAGEETTVLTVSGEANWDARRTRSYLITTPGSYRYYRLSMTSSEVGSASYQLAEAAMHNSPWQHDITGYATVSVASNTLTLQAPARGGLAVAKQKIAIATANTEHALKVVVDRGPVIFRVGSSDGGDEYIPETELDTGVHHLAFDATTGSIYIQFMSKARLQKIVSNCTIEAAGVLAIDAPWTADEMTGIRYDQSGDIVFMAHANWQQRKIERRAATSWSIARYETEDGPFMTSRSANVSLTPGALTGNTTLTSDRAFFKEAHVGCLFRLFHEGQETLTLIAGEGQYADAIRVAGVDADRVFNFSITGTWNGTLSRQRSYDSEDSGFIEFNTATGNVTSSLNDTFDNQIVWYRWGFKPGNYNYGQASLYFQFDGGGGRGICRVVAYNSATSVDIEILEPFSGTSATDDWLEGDWSDRRGWPSAVRFFDGRLWWAGRDRFWGSRSNSYYSYDADVEGDGGSIQRSVATGGSIAKVEWMLPLQRLIIGTQSSEVSARSSAFDEPLTPTNVTLKDASTQGSASYTPVKFDGRGIFIQRGGNRTYQLKYDFDASDYLAQPLMRINDTIGGDGITAIAVQRQPESYIWHVRADGQCPVLLYEPGEEVECWVRFITDGADGVVEDVIVLPGAGQDTVYFVVQRTVNSSTVRYLERLAKHSEAVGGASNLMADSYVTAAGPATSITAAHLISETGLIAWATNGDGDQVALTNLSADGSGVIALGGTYTDIVAGLPYSWRYKSAKLAYGAQQGTALLQPKRVSQLGLVLQSTHPDAVSFGPDFTNMDPMPRVENGAAIDENTIYDTYDEQAFPFLGNWDTDSRVCLKGSAPYPATLLGLVVGVETNET